MKLNKHDKLNAQERSTINNFFMPHSMSIWDKPEFQAQEQDNSNSKFLNKRLGDGDSITLTFVDAMVKMQPDNTAPEYRTKDGNELYFYFLLGDKELEIKQKDMNGSFAKAMKASAVEPDEVVTITRHGVNVETRWEITRASGNPHIVEEAPF